MNFSQKVSKPTGKVWDWTKMVSSEIYNVFLQINNSLKNLNFEKSWNNLRNN